MENKDALSIRKIKIQPKYLDYGTRKTTPQFLLSGLWLEEAGFVVGATVEISVRYKELVIKLIPEPEIVIVSGKISKKRKKATLDVI